MATLKSILGNLFVNDKEVAVKDGRGGVATAWVKIDAVAETIIDSFNIDSVIVLGGVTFQVAFTEPMDNADYVVITTTRATSTGDLSKVASNTTPTVDGLSVYTYNNTDNLGGIPAELYIVVFGGKDV